MGRIIVSPNQRRRFWHRALLGSIVLVGLADTVLADTVLADTVLADTVLADTVLADTVLADTVLADTVLADTAMAAGGSTETILVRGHIADAASRPLAGATVTLRPLETLWTTAITQLEGRAEPSVASTRTRRDGSFEITAPEDGPWTVVVRHLDHLAMRCELKPLLGPMDLPPLDLKQRRERRLTTFDPEGNPLSGVRVTVRGWAPKTEPTKHHCWQPEWRSGTTDANGHLILPTTADEHLPIAAISDDGFIYSQVSPGSGDVRLTLQESLVAARVVDELSQPVPKMAVMAGSSLALGMTGPGGDIRVPMKDEEDVHHLSFASPAGQFFGIVSAETASQQQLLLRLGPTRRVHGQVLDTTRRQPIAGAWVSFADTFHRTDPHGGYHLDLPVHGRPVVEAAAPGYLTRRVVVPAADSTATKSIVTKNTATKSTGTKSTATKRSASGKPPDLELNLALVGSLALAGRVVDKAGEAVVGADVVATVRVPRVEMSWAHLIHQFHMRSRADGRFLLEGLPPEITFELRANHRGFATGRIQVPALAAGKQPPEIEVVLEDGLTVFGVVLDDQEQPVPDAKVVLFMPPDFVSDPRPPAARVEPDQTVTDTHGRFELSDLARGTYSLQVTASDLAPLTVPGIQIAASEHPDDETRVDVGTVVLEPGVTLVGKVTDVDGQGLEGALLHIMRSGSRGSEQPTQTTTSADGGFAFAGMARSERLHISASLDGYQHKSVREILYDPDQPLTLMLEPSVNLRGWVIGPDGVGVSGADVALIRDKSSTIRSAERDGRFEFIAQAPGKVIVSARSPTGVADPVEVKLTAGETTPEVRIVLQPAATLRGRLTDPDGEPVFDARVSLGTPSGEHRSGAMMDDRSATTDGDGRFAITGLDTGDYPLAARHPDYEPLEDRVELESGVDRQIELAFDAPHDRESLTVSGHVIDSNGAGIDGAAIQLIGELRTSSDVAVVSFDGGGFELEASEPGVWALLVAHPGYATQRTATFELGKVAVTHQVIQLTAGGEVFGSVLGLDLEALSGLRITASALELGSRAGQVSHDGSYRISNLAAGAWVVNASTDQGQRVTKNVHLGGEGDAVEIDLVFEQGYRLNILALRDGSPWNRARAALMCQQAAFLGETTGNHGRFAFEGVPAGACEIKLTDIDQGAVTARRLIEMAGDDEIVIDVTTGRVAGQVLTRDRLVPIAGAVIELRSPRASIGGPPAARGETDASGTFELSSGSEGRWQLRAAAPGYATVEHTVEAAAGGNQILLSPAVPMTLYVRTADGGVPRYVTVVVKSPDGRMVEALPYYRPDADGRIEVTSLSPGLWNIQLLAKGQSAELELILPSGPVQAVLEALNQPSGKAH